MASAKDNRRTYTRKQQRIAGKTGTYGPRKLARSVAKAMRRSKGEKQSSIKGWRLMVAQLPPTGRRCLRQKGA